MDALKTFGNIQSGRVFMITDRKGVVSVVKIKRANPIRNWFNVEGDPYGYRRWISHYSWMFLTVN